MIDKRTSLFLQNMNSTSKRFCDRRPRGQTYKTIFCAIYDNFELNSDDFSLNLRKICVNDTEKGFISPSPDLIPSKISHVVKAKLECFSTVKFLCAMNETSPSNHSIQCVPIVKRKRRKKEKMTILTNFFEKFKKKIKKQRKRF